MDNEVIEDDDINLESFGDERDAPPRFRDKNHPIEVDDEDEENGDEDDNNDASGVEHLLHMMILISIIFMTIEAFFVIK